MSKTALFTVFVVAFLAGCAQQEEVTYVEPVTTEPVYTGKYGN